jgi:hypothetical protein
MTETQRAPWHIALLVGLSVFLLGAEMIEGQDGHIQAARVLALATIFVACGTVLLVRRGVRR